MKQKECDVCGNEIQLEWSRCPFCDSPQHWQTHVADSREKVRTVNLKAGMPTVDEGLKKLHSEIIRARHSGVKLIRIIHGWGSTGKGGKLRDAVRSFLRAEQRAKRIRSYVNGDEFSRHETAGRRLFVQYPELRQTERTDTRNRGITFIEL